MIEVDNIEDIESRLITLTGRVQGVGFRPFVQGLAQRSGLVGWVRNRAGNVELLVRGRRDILDIFANNLIQCAPPFSRPTLESVRSSSVRQLVDFSILESEAGDLSGVAIAPDQSICADCLAEIEDPSARRYRYPFTNCTQCGPRFTIITSLPYDRARTTMASFTMCTDCRQEYSDPLDRRFHAEPIACPVCGPRLQFVGADGSMTTTNDEALAAAVNSFRRGLTIAVKGVGGYHLMCDATSEHAVARLRQAKRRPHKPFAVMVPERPTDVGWTVRHLAEIDAVEEAALFDLARPIVLLRKRLDARIAPSIAPGLADIGLMLPYSPLHHLLLQEFGKPVVATSANVSGEPVLTDGVDVERRLAGCCDAFLHHDRPIERPADDPVVRVIAGKPVTLRLGRGLAPVGIRIPWSLGEPALACGGQIKATISLAHKDRVVVSPHIGDMGTLRSQRVFEQAALGLQSLHRIEAFHIVHDEHPGFASSRWARDQGKTTHAIRHHYAHASALLGEHGRSEPTLVFTWDGLGLGEDESLWGGETMLGSPGRWRRVGSFRPFRLIGGDRVAYQPWRSACAVCWEMGSPWKPRKSEADSLQIAWSQGAGLSSTAVGRLFDAAAALLGLIEEATYDGHGPALVEAVAGEAMRSDALPVSDVAGLRVIDWEPLMRPLLDPSSSVECRAALFHAILAATVLSEAVHWRTLQGISTVGLTGGVFQNRRLTESCVELLKAHNFHVLRHERIPPNDGGLSFGQAVEFAARSATYGARL